jgi:hypothetical protein
MHTDDAASLVGAYTRRFQKHFGDRVPATSAFGAWLLLALLAPAAVGERRVEIEKSLGCDAETAFAAAETLLTQPHPALACASAMWSHPDDLNALYRSWAATLPSVVQTGPVPAQEDADAWASVNTANMVEAFPITLTPDTVLVLASAVATQVTWETPYDVVPSGRLGGQFGERGLGALTGSGTSWLASTAAAGLVGVHQASANEGVGVLSVIADPAVPAAAVHDAALEILAAVDRGHDGAGRGGLALHLSDVPLGDGHAWTLEEVDGFGDRLSAVLPAWRAEPDPFNIAAAPGFPAALWTALSMLHDPLDASARQSVFAEYTAAGFRAAAVTAVAMRAAGVPQMRRVRVGELRFARPYATVAYTVDKAPGGTWSGVPVFSTWVTDGQLIVAEPADVQTFTASLPGE